MYIDRKKKLGINMRLPPMLEMVENGLGGLRLVVVRNAFLYGNEQRCVSQTPSQARQPGDWWTTRKHQTCYDDADAEKIIMGVYNLNCNRFVRGTGGGVEELKTSSWHTQIYYPDQQIRSFRTTTCLPFFPRSDTECRVHVYTKSKKNTWIFPFCTK